MGFDTFTQRTRQSSIRRSLHRMKEMRFTSLLCLLPILCIGCSTQVFDPKDSNHTFIAVGSGGGFTGIETTYYLLENGQVFRQVGTAGSIQAETRIERNVATQLFGSSHEFDLMHYQYDQPGNAYRFLHLQFGEVHNRIIWARDDATVRSQCKEIYTLLNQLIQEKS